MYRHSTPAHLYVLLLLVFFHAISAASDRTTSAPPLLPSTLAALVERVEADMFVTRDTRLSLVLRPGLGLGAVALAAIPAGTRLLSIPGRSIAAAPSDSDVMGITPAAVARRLAAAYAAVDDNDDDHKASLLLEDTALLAVRLIVASRSHQLLRPADAALAPLLDLLPGDLRGNLAPLLWGDAELDELLGGTAALGLIRRLQREARAWYDTLFAAPPKDKRTRGKKQSTTTSQAVPPRLLGVRLADLAAPTNDSGDAGDGDGPAVTFGEFSWAVATVMAHSSLLAVPRRVQGGGAGRTVRAIVPWANLLNHHSPNTSNAVFVLRWEEGLENDEEQSGNGDEVDQSLTSGGLLRANVVADVRSTTAIAAGDQVTLSYTLDQEGYQATTTRSSLFLAWYGFTEQCMEDDTVGRRKSCVAAHVRREEAAAAVAVDAAAATAAATAVATAAESADVDTIVPAIVVTHGVPLVVDRIARGSEIRELVRILDIVTGREERGERGEGARGDDQSGNDAGSADGGREKRCNEDGLDGEQGLESCTLVSPSPSLSPLPSPSPSSSTPRTPADPRLRQWLAHQASHSPANRLYPPSMAVVSIAGVFGKDDQYDLLRRRSSTTNTASTTSTGGIRMSIHSPLHSTTGAACRLVRRITNILNGKGGDEGNQKKKKKKKKTKKGKRKGNRKGKRKKNKRTGQGVTFNSTTDTFLLDSFTGTIWPDAAALYRYGLDTSKSSRSSKPSSVTSSSPPSLLSAESAWAPHVDTGTKGRCVTAVVVLGDAGPRGDFEGGDLQLRICGDGGRGGRGGGRGGAAGAGRGGGCRVARSVAGKAGRLITFLAGDLHNVSPVVRGERDVLVVWYNCRRDLAVLTKVLEDTK